MTPKTPEVRSENTHKSIEEIKAEVTRCVLEAWREQRSVTGAVNEIMELIEARAQQQVEEAVDEYKQFVLNVLDGVDIADEQMENIGGGTKAIRLALLSRSTLKSNLPDKE